MSEKGFMQTRCHSQSVTKLVRAPQLQQSASRVAEREGIHADTLSRPVRDEASQGSTASAEAKAGGRARRIHAHAATTSP